MSEVRPLPEVLRSRAWEDRQHRQLRELAAITIERQASRLASLEKENAELRAALEPFAEFADGTVDEIGWTDARPRERISTWFGPSDFRRARTAYTTIRRTTP